MKLYENIVIGNFLYGLGVSVGARLRGTRLPAAINLLQQTPEDKALGDVLLSFPGTLRLIEFKSATNTSGKEEIRHRKLTHALEKLRHLTQLSHRLHWYVETSTDEVRGLKTFYSDYLSAFSPSVRHGEPLNLERFIARMVEDIATGDNQPEDPQAVRQYLQLIRWCQGVKENTQAGALIVTTDGQGNLHYAELKNIMELSMTHAQWLEYRQLPEYHIEPQQHVIDYEGPETGRGMSF